MTTILSPRQITGASEPWRGAAARKSSGGLRLLSALGSWVGEKRISATARGAGRAGVARLPAHGHRGAAAQVLLAAVAGVGKPLCRMLSLFPS